MTTTATELQVYEACCSCAQPKNPTYTTCVCIRIKELKKCIIDHNEHEAISTSNQKGWVSMHMTNVALNKEHAICTFTLLFLISIFMPICILQSVY